MLGKWYTGVFSKIEPINKTVWKFWVKLPEVDKIDFVPGQFMTFDLPIHEKRHKRLRSYSIASAPDGTNELEFVIVLLEGGLGTTYLFNEVEVGTPLKLRGALGKFTLPPTLDLNKEICFICTGTGLAPFRSMLWYLHRNQLPYPKMHLIFGTRYLDGVLYRKEMEQLSREMEGLEYHITLSREKSPEWTGRNGYVHPIYEELYADKRPVTFYLCGWNVMLDEAKKRLMEMGYDRKSIVYESYG